MRGLFVTGTSTGVGKTAVAAALALLLKRKKVDVGVMKPFATADKPFSKKFRSKDTAILAAAAGSVDNDLLLNPFFYPLAASPFMASLVCKMPPADVHAAAEAVSAMSRLHEYLIVEGIGGLMVPISAEHTVASFAKLISMPVVIVTTPFLGTINHTLLTLLACRVYDLDVAGIIINRMPKTPSRVEKQTPDFLGRITGTEILATVPATHGPSASEIARRLSNSKGIQKLLAADHP